MERTRESWKPIVHLLEGNFQVFLGNAAPVTRVPGRQTNQADAQWLARLLWDGLL